MAKPDIELLDEEPAPVDDLTGRDRMTWNVVTSWVGHLVFVVAGFVLPRLIDSHIGQESLGVWDFGWSLISYFWLISGGVTTSVSRYVARYRAADDPEGIDATVSTGLVILLFVSLLVLIFTVTTTAFLPELFGDRIAGHENAARWVVLLLGLSLVCQFVFGVFNGVVTGCHRWDMHNAITSGSYLLTACGMIVALVLGGGLRAMAAVTLAGEGLAGVLRLWAAYRFCPGLSLSIQRVSRETASEMIRFGGKSVLAVVSYVILYQTSNLLVMWYLGPASLALYARPSALVRHTGRFVTKFAYVLSPTASALDAGTDREALRDLFVSGMKYSLYMALPMLLTLTVLGGSVLRLWMGDRYEEGLVLTILAVGHIAAFSQEGTYQILVGVGRHGLPGAVRLAAALCTVPLAVLGLGTFGWGLIGAASALVVPLTIVNALVIPLYGCRVVGIPYLRYVAHSTIGPIAASVPFAGCLIVARLIWPDRPAPALGFGLGLGGVVLTAIYWWYVLPERIREKARKLVGRGRTG